MINFLQKYFFVAYNIDLQLAQTGKSSYANRLLYGQNH